ncbi:putative reverse transcriptase domain-containing protein [Tanacetum coccineum]
MVDTDQQILEGFCCTRDVGFREDFYGMASSHSFKGTEGVVGLKRWFEKMEQVFEICKCAKDDKVKFAMCTFEGRALTWWNGNVQTLGLANANQIPWSNVKAMMTTEYCPATEIQRMEQELWTLTLKGDDIEAYNNRFHELALMCHELVPTEKKKIESKSHKVLGIAPVDIIDRQLPFEYTVTSKSTDVTVLVLRVEKKMFVIEQPIPPTPTVDSKANVLAK